MKANKKIRVVQFGVGPIGASIARLAREKASLEIVGAIDRDPAKAGRDLGEVAGAPDARGALQFPPARPPRSISPWMLCCTRLRRISKT